MATILYARVSTADQTIDHQVAHATAAGFAIDDVVSDNGVSGVSTRLVERAEGKRLFDLLRRGDVLVVRWVDRLGRNYEDVCDVIRQFMKCGVIIRTVINNMTFDGATKDPMQMAVRDALIAFMAATAQAVSHGAAQSFVSLATEAELGEAFHRMDIRRSIEISTRREPAGWASISGSYRRFDTYPGPRNGVVGQMLPSAITLARFQYGENGDIVHNSLEGIERQMPITQRTRRSRCAIAFQPPW
jgi:putative DNA-invertase from lambdoid prophage Rac